MSAITEFAMRPVPRPVEPDRRAVFACTALLGTNKTGVLRPNTDGYYTLVLGALNVFNSGGAYYPYDTAKGLFCESSSLMRRIASGALRGEYGHPRPLPNQSTRDFLNRVLDIYEPNVCCHIRKVWIDYSGSVRDDSGRPVIAILGEVKPSGPMGPALQKSLDNPSENVCFSIRSVTNDCTVQGTVHKNLKMIVTWDYVNEPGLSAAKKWHSPSLESLMQETTFIAEHLRALKTQQNQNSHVAMESSGGLSAETVLNELGWDGSGVAMEQDVLQNGPAWTRW